MHSLSEIYETVLKRLRKERHSMASSQDPSSSDEIDWSAILAASIEKTENETTYNPDAVPGIVPFVDRGTDGPQLSEY